MPKRNLAAAALSLAFVLAWAFPRSAPADDPFPVRVIEAQDNKLNLQSSGPAFQRTVTLALADGQADLSLFRVALGPLAREDGRPISADALKCHGCGNGLRLTKGAWLALTLSGSGLEPGSVASFLQLSTTNRTLIIPLTVTRAAPAATAQIVVPAAWAATLGLGTPLNFVFDVHETSGRDATVRRPSITPLQVADKSGAWRAVKDGLHTIALSGEPVVSVRTTPDTVTLAAGAYTRFRVSFGDLPAGSYKGQIRLSGPDSAEVSQDFTLTLKDPPYCALVVIALGVVAAYLLNRWTRGERNRKVRRLAMLTEQERLNEAYRHASVKPDPVWDELLKRAGDLLIQNSVALPSGAETADTVKTALDDLGLRRQRYAQVLEVKKAVDSLLDAYPEDMTEERDRFRKDAAAAFASAQASMLKRQGEGLDVDVLKPLQDVYDGARKAAIETPVKALQAKVGEIKKAEDEAVAALGVETDGDMTRRLEAITGLLDSAKALAGKNDYVGASGTLEQARRDLVTLWRSQLERLERELTHKLTQDEKWKPVRDDLTLFARHMANASAERRTDQASRNLHSANVALASAIAAYKKIKAPSASVPVGPREAFGGGGESAAPQGERWLTIARTLGLLPSARFVDVPPRQETAASLVGEIKTNDLLVTSTIIVAACLTGFASLYLDVATFGGRDYITAFLWGFGWQALTGTLISLGTEAGLLQRT